ALLERPGPLADGKTDVDRRIDDVVIAKGDLVRREGRAAARAVRDHLVALIEKSPIPNLPEAPPDGLDVVVRERHVRVVQIDPEADPLGQPVPVLDIGEHRLAAPLVELGDPIALDLLLRADPERALDLELDREAVAVPARLPRHVVAAHRLVPGEDVLED